MDITKTMKSNKLRDLFLRQESSQNKDDIQNSENSSRPAPNSTEVARLQQQLISSKKHINAAEQITEIGSWEYLIDEDKLYCSDNFFHIFGIDKEESISMRKPFKLVHPHDYENTYDKFQTAIENGEGFVNEFRIKHGKLKDIRYIKVCTEVNFKDDQLYKLIGVVKDETYQINLEGQVAELKEDYSYMFDNLSSGIWMRESLNGKFSYASKGLEDILEIPLSRLYAEDGIWYKMIQPECINVVKVGIKEVSEGRSTQVIYRIISGNGKTKWLLEQIVPKVNEYGKIIKIFGLVSDITSQMKIKEKLIYISKYDPLTGLPNQKSLYEQMDKLCELGDPFAVLYLDIDRFSIINNSLGYHVGDEALKIMTSRFSAIIGRNGYLARLSSNDFIIIMQNFKTKKDIYNLAEQIIRETEVPFVVDDYELYVSTSIGITFFPEEGDDKLLLIENAHTALCHAKQEGKNNFQLYSHLTDISSYKKYVLDRDLRKAIRNGEFELYFQPQVDPRNGGICGAEALIRWNHTEWGLVSPAEFIPLAEENHMISHITDWVIQKVFTTIRDWLNRGLHVQPISINISPKRFAKKGLLSFIEQLLEMYKVSAHYIELEITESSLLKNDSNVISTIHGLKELGIKIAIDDFGTGYASFDSLRKIKPNTIKIDQTFIKHIGDEDGIERGIISSAINLSKKLGMKVVAEGVEELEQLKFLKQNECDFIQGYIYSKPVKAKTFEILLEHGYLRTEKSSVGKVYKEKRKYFRFHFPFPVPGEMTIVEVDGKIINVGKSQILIDDIGIGGAKVLSILKLPVNTHMKFSIRCQLLNEKFEFTGSIRWIEEVTRGVYSYGILFEINRILEGRLASVINRLSSYSKNGRNIPDTIFVYETVHKYFTNK